MRKRPFPLTPGMRTFLVIWVGQLISRIGTAMTRFALLIWAYQQTGSAMAVALLGFASFVPMVLLGPLAGVLIDRFDRRRILLLADLGAGVMTALLLALVAADRLQTWHLYAIVGAAGAFEVFQEPAHSAVTSVLLPPAQYGRANGLRATIQYGAQVLAPLLGSLCLLWIGLGGILLLDLATFLAALATLLLVRVPAVAEETAAAPGRLRQEMRVGFGFIRQRPGLLGLTLISTAIHFFAAFTWLSILPAMILARSGGSEAALAAVQSAMGLAGVVGGLVVSLWGGPRNKLAGFLLGVIFSFLLGDIPLALGRSQAVWVAAGALGSFFIPILMSARQSIWQTQVPPVLQGRVFATRNTFANLVMPLGYLLGGITADYLLEPAMAPGGALTGPFGPLVGVGPGTGMALMFVASALLAITMCLAAFFVPAIRHVETNLPDYGATTKPLASSASSRPPSSNAHTVQL